MIPFPLKKLPTVRHHNQDGFTLISFLFFLPIIMILLWTLVFSLEFMNIKKQVDNMCHRYTMESQQYLIEGNDKILILNRQARALILEKIFLNSLILTAPPQVKIPAKIRKRFVVAQQKKLKLKQITLKNLYLSKSRARLFQLRIEFNRWTRRLAKKWGASQPRPAQINLNANPSAIKVSWLDIAPTYKRGLGHSRQQLVSAKWVIPIGSYVPQWAAQWIKTQKKWRGICQSHPHKQGGKWLSAIGKGRHL